jgi:hypothetical protein
MPSLREMLDVLKRPGGIAVVRAALSRLSAGDATMTTIDALAFARRVDDPEAEQALLRLHTRRAPHD